jgi:hypothetical protein
MIPKGKTYRVMWADAKLVRCMGAQRGVTGGSWSNAPTPVCSIAERFNTLPINAIGDMNVAIDKQRWSADLAESGCAGGQDSNGNGKGSRSQGSLALNALVPRPTDSRPDHRKLSGLAD